MKLYVVYYRTMQDSPDVTIVCVTADESVANENFLLAKKWEEEFMEDVDEDSGDWAEARMESFEVAGDRKPGDNVFVYVETMWLECIETSVHPFLSSADAKSLLDERKKGYLEDYPELTPFDEDETFEESTHLEDPSVAIDVYFDVVVTAIR